MSQTRLHFISFGSRRPYLNLSRRTLLEISAVYPQANCTALSTSDLGEEAGPLRLYARQYPKGYGYWRWKPLALSIALMRTEPGDIVVYLDGRSGIPVNPIPWIDELVEDPSIALSALQMESQPECMWTTGDLFEFFGFDTSGPEALSGQFAGGLFGLRHNESMKSLLSEWRSVVLNQGELCRDEPSARPNHPYFVENRYDQSVFSLTVKKHIKAGLSVRILGESDVSGISAIRPQAKPHPRWGVLADRLKVVMSGWRSATSV